MRSPLARSDIRPTLAPVEPLAPITPAIPPHWEHFRRLYLSLTLPKEQGAVIGITSAVAGEGRTTVALGLAQTLAVDLASPVVLVEADLANPSLSRRFRLPQSPGLADVLNGRVSLEDASTAVDENLLVVPGGGNEADLPRLFRRFQDITPLHAAASPVAVTVLDLPPVLEHSYTGLAAAVADALVLVIRADVTPFPALRAAVDRLAGCSLQGAVLLGGRR